MSDKNPKGSGNIQKGPQMPFTNERGSRTIPPASSGPPAPPPRQK